MDLSTYLSYQQGTLPSRYWYQLNGKSATENYTEQRLATDSEEEVIVQSEVSIK
ncbi:MAG: hypothetical protein IJ403_00685 [Oscillospiraceae bacterium]|nr:hypothetical protein [Oscillospiraceae bacterium]